MRAPRSRCSSRVLVLSQSRRALPWSLARGLALVICVCLFVIVSSLRACLRGRRTPSVDEVCGGAKSISRAGVARSLVAQSSGGAQPCSEKASALAAVARATSRSGATGTAREGTSDGVVAPPAKSAGRAIAKGDEPRCGKAAQSRRRPMGIVENVVAPSEEAAMREMINCGK